MLAPAALALLALLAGCESTKIAEPAKAVPVETRSPVRAATPATPSAPAVAAATPQSRVATVDLAANRAAGGGANTAVAGAGATAALTLPSQRIVYFDFDSFVIKDDYKGVLDGYGRYLSAQRGTHLVVEGHTDERGGREYNLALGQKRAEAVVKSLKLLGANDGQLEAVSYGEERPAAAGNDEAAWAKNRRAELKAR
jgi:peptidoglycan-associated lipoprotein